MLMFHSEGEKFDLFINLISFNSVIFLFSQNADLFDFML